MIKIVVDSTSDIPSDLSAAHGIAVVPVLVQIGQESLRDTVDITRDTYYARLITSEELPKTSAPSVGMFEEQFRALASDGSAIISISLTGSQSATFGAAQQAARLVEGARIACVDSRSIGMPLTYLALAAVQAVQQGCGFEEVVGLVERMRSRLVVYVALETLRYLERGGRIGRARALLGAMLNVKPILEVRDGEIHPVEQVRSWRRVPTRLVELAQARGTYAELSVQYTTDRQAAEDLAGLCAASGLMRSERIRVVQVGAALGTHVGPGGLAITGLLNEVTG